jgi:hypothetical protein
LLWMLHPFERAWAQKWAQSAHFEGCLQSLHCSKVLI